MCLVVNPHLASADRTSYCENPGNSCQISSRQVLSGGEQAKVRLCKLINQETNLLILDEPTNHLDVDAKDELKRALKDYHGSVLLVCHEPEFYSDIVTKVWNLEEYSVLTL